MNAVNIVKRRAVAQDMIQNRVVFVNDVEAKASKEIKPGDTITIKYLNGEKRYRVLKIPETKTIPKSKKNDYIQEIYE